MDKFLNFKTKKEKKKIQEPNILRMGVQVKIIKGPLKGLIGTVRHIKENKWVYVITCMNDHKSEKIPVENIILI